MVHLTQNGTKAIEPRIEQHCDSFRSPNTFSSKSFYIFVLLGGIVYFVCLASSSIWFLQNHIRGYTKSWNLIIVAFFNQLGQLQVILFTYLDPWLRQWVNIHVCHPSRFSSQQLFNLYDGKLPGLARTKREQIVNGTNCKAPVWTKTSRFSRLNENLFAICRANIGRVLGMSYGVRMKLSRSFSLLCISAPVRPHVIQHFVFLFYLSVEHLTSVQTLSNQLASSISQHSHGKRLIP